MKHFCYIPTMEERTMVNKIWDKVGICASGLCLIHCLATPILLILIPASMFTNIHFEITHQIFAVVVTSSILLAVYPTCKEHGHYDIIGLALIGITLILCAVFFHDYASETVSHGTTVIGSIILITAHIKNMKIRHGKCESDSQCSSDH